MRESAGRGREGGEDEESVGQGGEGVERDGRAC